MPALRERVARIKPRNLGRLLIVSFSLTVLSFLASNIVAETMASGIARSASSIANTAMPVASSISRVLAELDEQMMLLSEMIDRLAAGQQSSALVGKLQEARVAETRYWQTVQSLPAAPEQISLYESIGEHLARLDRSVDLVLRETAQNDEPGASDIRNHELRPEVEQVRAELRTVGQYSRKHATELSDQIASSFSMARLFGWSLNVLSALLASLTAFAVARVVESYAEFAEVRVSELETFAGRVAHDIRSPITSVALALELSRRNTTLDANARAILDRGTRTVQRVGQLVDGLLVFARAGAQPTGGERAPTAAVVDDVVQAIRPAAAEKGIEVAVEPGSQCVAACHPGVLTSIVSNLLGNAIKYMGDASIRRVTLRVRCSGRMVCVDVQDTGPGVPPDMRERVFLPHVRIAGADVPGLGLGLATVRRLAEAHGGSAIIASTSGEGSLFRVELPQAV